MLLRARISTQGGCVPNIAVYVDAHKNQPSTRAASAYALVAAALRKITRQDERDTAPWRTVDEISLFDSRRESRDRVVALGMDAHLRLAGSQKRTLLAAAFVDDASYAMPARDLDRFVWSCSNTSRLVLLGRTVWQDAQLLPAETLALHEMPPLDLPGSDCVENRIVVIDHDGAAPAGRDVAALLRRQLPTVDHVDARAANAFRSGARCGIHVHVGRHAITDEALRLVDSWRSRRVVVHVVAGRFAPDGHEADLAVADGVNGFSCRTAAAVPVRLEELRSDPILRQRFRDNGEDNVAPLVQGWDAIARELVA